MAVPGLDPGINPAIHDYPHAEGVDARPKAGHDGGEGRMNDNALRVEDAVNETCPWSGKPIAADSLALYKGAVVGFCNPGCRDKFETAVAHFEGALQARRADSAGNSE